MPSVSWQPEEMKPAAAARLEDEIRRVAPDAEVRLTLRDGAWFVRALRPAAICSRGGGVASRDVSAIVAEVLADHDVPARTSSR